MDVMIEFLIDTLAGWIAKSKHLSTGVKSVLIFLVLNLLNIALVWVMIEFWHDLVITILTGLMVLFWLTCSIIAVIRGHKRKWVID